MGLSITLTNDPLDPGIYLGMAIELDEWDALFLKDLEIPEPARLPGEGRTDHLERWESDFVGIMREKGFPLFGRIWHYNVDVYYESVSIEALFHECLELKSHVGSQGGKVALDKLDHACREALRAGSGIFLGGD